MGASELRLGHGRFAEVKVSKSSEDVAVKTIFVDSQRQPHNWKAEVAALERLSGASHIITMLRYTPSLNSMDPEVRIEMPRYALTLEEVIYQNAKASYPAGSGWRNVMPMSRALEIVAGIADGLSFIHGNSIIHRDIKPENILFASLEGEPTIIDFGVAWVPGISDIAEPAGNRVTDVSTGEYKAPELLFGIRKYDEKVDIWALGCILARLLGPDCNSPFHPYSSDMGLLASQFEVLGRPSLADAPSLGGTLAETMMEKGGEKNRALKLRKFPDGRNDVESVLYSMLNYEWPSRLSAREVALALH